MKNVTLGIGAVLTCVMAGAIVACSHPGTKVSKSWNPKAAANYLDYRAGWWMDWTGSARDHGTVCISCHTALPYALARPALRAKLEEQGPSINERRLIDDVIKRVRLGADSGPYYGDEVGVQKTAESRGTEAVLNALILASYDAQTGQLSDNTRKAFTNMWATQQKAGEKKGSWLWLQFDLEPWEANDSAYYGATLAAAAVGIAPESYKSSAEIQDGTTLLRDYLNRESSTQSAINRVFLLSASTKLPGLLTPEKQQAIVHEILNKQQADGGWRLSSIAPTPKNSGISSLLSAWFRSDGTLRDGASDGVATSVAVLALEEAGVTPDNSQLQRGLSWLMNTQNTNAGFWPASSLNKRRNPSSDIGRFMSDAATAYAVLALTESERPRNSVASMSNH